MAILVLRRSVLLWATAVVLPVLLLLVVLVGEDGVLHRRGLGVGVMLDACRPLHGTGERR